MFIGRQKELAELDRMYKSDKFELAVIYGRRRVGKSTLIKEFCKGKNYIYYAGIEGGTKDNISALSRLVMDHIMPGIEMPVFESYDALFDFVDGIASERLILVIDEYPYLAQGDHSLSSILQRHIDLRWKDSRLMLILCGSSMSFMENQVLGYKSPLYGRRTAQFKIEPFEFNELREFGWDYSPEDLAVIYGITGGIAEYLEFIDPAKSVRDNITDLFLNPRGRMYEEPLNLLKQELRDPSMYNSILNSIVSGNSTLNDIASKAGELPTSASFHLKSLIELGIVKKETPMGTKASSRKSLYSILDASFIFWYRFVYGNQSAIALNNGEFIYEKLVLPNLSTYMGRIFEAMAQRYMLYPSVYQNAPFFYPSVGRWWGSNPEKKRQEEIDVCAMDNHNVLLGECKWTAEKIGQPVLNRLIEKGRLFSQEQKYYYLFSKNGFSESVIETARRRDDLYLVTIEDILLA